MRRLLLSFFRWFAAFIRSRHDLGLEFVALASAIRRAKRKKPHPRLGSAVLDCIPGVVVEVGRVHETRILCGRERLESSDSPVSDGPVFGDGSSSPQGGSNQNSVSFVTGDVMSTSFVTARMNTKIPAKPGIDCTFLIESGLVLS